MSKAKGIDTEYRVDLPNAQAVSRETLRALMPQMVEVLKAEALERTPIGKTRNLVKSIFGRVERDGMQGAVGSKAPHAHLVHEGTRAHPVPLYGARALSIPSGGHVVYRGSAEHPGSRANPWLKQSLESSGDALAGMLRHAGEAALSEAIGKSK
jgi:hypothetical protein